MQLILTTVFVASLLGSLHCVGMCGPFALIASSSQQGERKKTWLPTLAYSLGRLSTYSIVGFVFGSIGLAINAGTNFSSWQQTATWLAGGLMIAVGVVSLLRCFGFRVPLPQSMLPVQKLIQKGFGWTQSLRPLHKAFAIGAMASLMPCGWLYTFAIAAAGLGSPLQGALLMAVFWLGTVPLMVTLMLGFGKLQARFQKQVPVTMAVLVIGVGIFTMAFRAPIALGDGTQVTSDRSELKQKLETVDHSQLPCCRGKQ